MLGLYNFLLPVLVLMGRAAGLISPKVRRGLAGRAGLINDVQQHYNGISPRRKRVLIHAASYGELEQAKPVIARIRSEYPEAHIHLTFFSPSGYENAVGKYNEVDYISYSPLDSKAIVKEFLNAVHPEVALFTRYDVWPNLAMELKARAIPSILFSATAAQESKRTMPFAKSLHGEIYRSLSRILAIGESDARQFRALGVRAEALEVAGDTRFDQVIRRKEASRSQNPLPDFLQKRIEEKGTLVFSVGSSWPEDEASIRLTLRMSIERQDNILTVIVPHEPSESHVRKLLSEYSVNAIRLSQIEDYKREPIIIVDSIGKLFGLYRYADIAMVGGGFGGGVHNVLEAAVWGCPVIVGPKHQRSGEVADLIEKLAAFEIKSAEEFDFVFWQLVKDDDLRNSAGEKAQTFVLEGQGATERVFQAIQNLLQERS